MSFFEKFSKVDQKFSWSFLGFIIGIIGIGFTIYTVFFFEKVPIIKYEIVSNTNVLDIKENVSRLDILFDSVSVKKTGKELRVITLKITNDGNENFNPDYFDNKFPLGFQIEGAKIVQKPDLLNFSNDYIRESIELIEKDHNKVFFSNIIIDQGEFFTIKTLTLSDQGVIPTIKPLGYVSGSGIPKLVEVVNETETSPKSFFRTLFYGNIGYHILRFIVYIITISLAVFVIAFPISEFQEAKEKKNKKKNVSKFKKNTKIEKELLVERVFEIYLESGESNLFRIKRIISQPENLIEYKKYLELSEKFNDFEFSGFRNNPENKEDLHFEQKTHENDRLEDNQTFIDELVKDQIIKLDGEKYIVNKNFEKTLDEFIYFIKIQ